MLRNNNHKKTFVLSASPAALAAFTALAASVPLSAATAQTFAQPTLNTYANIVGTLSYQYEETLLPEQPNFDFVGSGGLIISRDKDADEYQAEVFVEDPLSQLTEGSVVADAPRDGDFLVDVKLVDTAGKSFELFVTPDKAHLPTVVVDNKSFNKSLFVTAGVDYTAGRYQVGGSIAFDVDDIKDSTLAQIDSALLYVGSDQYGTLRLGKNLSLPFGTRDPQVISGGTFSFADFGDWQVSYVSPIWNGFRAAVLAGKGDDGTVNFAGSAQYQVTYGDSQFRVGGYADTAKSWQGLAGYSYRFSPDGFAGLSGRYGRDGTLESFASLEATLQYKKHFLSAGVERVWSNNLDLLYANNDNAFFSLSIRDTEGFNREDRFSLGYSYTLNQNLQLFANARHVRHKFYKSRNEISAGVRYAF